MNQNYLVGNGIVHILFEFGDVTGVVGACQVNTLALGIVGKEGECIYVTVSISSGRIRV